MDTQLAARAIGHIGEASSSDRRQYYLKVMSLWSLLGTGQQQPSVQA